MIADQQSGGGHISEGLHFHVENPQEPAGSMLQPGRARPGQRMALAKPAPDGVGASREHKLTREPKQPARDTQRMIEPGFHSRVSAQKSLSGQGG